MVTSLSLAIELQSCGLTCEADRAYCAILAEQPRHAGALQLLGALCQQQGRHDEALDLIGRAIAVNPSNAVFHNNYGAALLSLERFAEAEESFRRALAIRQDYGDALANFGMAQAALGNDAAAEGSFRRALQCQPWHRDATTRLARLFHRHGREKEAAQLLEAALAAAPWAETPLAALHLFAAVGRVEEGAEHFRAAIMASVPRRADEEAGDRLVYDGRWHREIATRSVGESNAPLPPAPLAEKSGVRSQELEYELPSPPAPLPDGEGRIRIAFVSPHCVLDFTNGAATATLDLLKLLAGIGFPCEVFCGTRANGWDRARIDDVLRQRGGPFTVREARVGPFNARMIFAAHGNVPVTMVDTEGRTLTAGPYPEGRGEEACGFRDGLREVLGPLSAERGLDLRRRSGGDGRAGYGQAARHRGRFRAAQLLLHRPRTLSAWRTASSCPRNSPGGITARSSAWNAKCLPLAIDPERVKVGSGENRPHPGPLPEGEGDLLPAPCSPLPASCVTFVNPEPRKGIHVFARIAEVLSRRRPDIPLLMVEGVSKASFLPKLGIDPALVKNVRVMPNSPDARRFLAVTKLLLMPSLMENAAVVAMEAMFNGIPVLASNRGGLPETVRGSPHPNPLPASEGTGGILLDIPARYTAETRDVPTAEEAAPWIETIIRLWDDAAYYARCSLAARQRAQAWHPDRLAPLYRDFFRRIATTGVRRQAAGMRL